ncbi:MAG: hypothetical protein FIB02_03365 [Desulfuromonas sp.]|nr:hypothetical protein [Desulfuromonas sp.]
MLSNRQVRWLLWLVVVVTTVGLAAMTLKFQEPANAVLQVDTVTVSHDVAGKARLAVGGRGLHDGLQALLFPDPQGVDTGSSPVDVSVTIPHYATDGRLAVATTSDQRLLALDVTAGRRVEVRGGIRLSPQKVASNEVLINGVTLVGSKAVVGRSNFGLILVDVNDPAAPREVDRLELTGNFTDLEGAGETVYAINNLSGLLSVAIEGERLRSRQVPGSEGAWRLAVSGRRLVTVGQKGLLTLYERDTRGEAQPIGKVQLPWGVRDLVIARETLYLCTVNGQLQAFSLASWPRLGPPATLDLKGRPLRLEAAPEEQLLFCTLVGKGVAVIDVSRAAAPQSAGLITTSRVATSLQFHSGRLFLTGLSGLQVLPLETLKNLPASPESDYPFEIIQGKVKLLPWGDKILAYDLNGLAVLPDADGGVSPAGSERRPDAPLLALPDPSGLRLHAIRGGLPEMQPSSRMTISDSDSDPIITTGWHAGGLYVLSQLRLRIFNCNPAGTLVLAGEYRPPGIAVAMAWLDPGFMVVVSRSENFSGFEVIDVSTPAKPRVIGSRPIPRHQWTVGDINDLLIDGTRLFVSRSRLGVEIFDLANPAEPKLLQRIDTPGNAYKLSLGNGLLAVGDQDEGLFIIDVHGEFGVPVRSYRLPTIAYDVLLHNKQIFVVNSTGGILRFPMPRRLIPERRSAGNAMDLPLPAGVPPGRYILALYDGENTVDVPVVLQ